MLDIIFEKLLIMESFGNELKLHSQSLFWFKCWLIVVDGDGTLFWAWVDWWYSTSHVPGDHFIKKNKSIISYMKFKRTKSK